MAVFTYKAADRLGKIVSGSMDAVSREVVISRLQQTDCFPIEIIEKKKAKVPFFESFQRIRGKDVLRFTQQLSVLLTSGIQLDRSLAILAELTENKKLSTIIENVQHRVEAGSSFADALRKFPQAFPKLYVNMVRAGEAGGILDLIIERISSFLDESQRLKDDVTSALIYPILLSVVGVSAIAILLIFVVPRFAQMFADMGQSLPLPTEILITSCNFIGHYWWLLITLLALLISSTSYYLHTPTGRLRYDGFKLRLPLIGPLARMVAVARFARTLGTLIASGVPILQGLTIVREVIGNEVIAQHMAHVREVLKDGGSMSVPLRESHVFPPLAVHMVAVGEESGQLDSMLLRIAENFDLEVRSSVKRVVAFIEPAMIVIMGVVVGFIVISMLLAIFSVNEIPM